MKALEIRQGCDNSMEKISELQMANAFEELLNSNSGIKGFPNFSSVFREVPCQQGIADFIVVSGNIISKNSISFIESGNVSLSSSSRIVSLLKSRSPRTEDFIVNSTGLSVNTVKRILKQLEENDIVFQISSGSYVISPKMQTPKVELWAFELKLRDWKRALFQALQYKAFANRTVIVLPEDKLSVAKKNIETFIELNVGLMVFQPIDLSYEIIVKPQKSNPSSKCHNLFALYQIMSEMKSCNLNKEIKK